MKMNNFIDINEIMKLIPHRYPFLLVDKILEYKPQESIIGLKNITMNEPQFQGHFPTKPIMPGVLIIEALAQLSAVLVAKSLDITEDKEVFFMSIGDTKFRKIITPGDSLIMEANIIQNRGSVWKFNAMAKVDGEVAAESVFTAMVKTINQE